MYSLAWKAATGVAAAEGLAIGGWSCKAVRLQQSEVAKSSAELARLRKQAAHELTALRALLQQQDASHTHEVCREGRGRMDGWCRVLCACVWRGRAAQQLTAIWVLWKQQDVSHTHEVSQQRVVEALQLSSVQGGVR
jgi:hypothetical protein